MTAFSETFYFVRHGETDWNKAGVYQGQNDIPLNETGIRQAQERAPHITGLGIDAVYASPLLRARKTAEILVQPLIESGQDMDIIDLPEMMECQSVAAAKYVLEKKGIKDMPNFDKMPADSSETPESFVSRVCSGLHKVLTGGHAMPLIVVHGGVSTALCDVLDIPTIRTPNCCLVRFEYINGKYEAIFTP